MYISGTFSPPGRAPEPGLRLAPNLQRLAASACFPVRSHTVMQLSEVPTWEFDAEDFGAEFSHCYTGECRISVLPVLYRVAQTIARTADLAGALSMILEVMQQQLKMKRGVVTLYDRSSETIFIHDCFGLSQEEKKRGIYAPGEGVTGKAVETGMALVAQGLGRNPVFLDRTGAYARRGRPGEKFFCVPVAHAGKVLGTIGAERVYMNKRLLRQDIELLTMIAAMIAPAAELYLTENLDKVRLETENRRLRTALKERFRPANMIGSSKPMLEVYGLIEKVAAAKATVLILGESGVGKELVANAIHFNSPVCEGPFIKSNCAALPEALAESELFGHERGAFTGALTLHKGSFEMADGGAIFLDEVGELSLAVQAKLLRVLQERTFERVGGSKPIKVSVRIIAATNRNLAEMVEQGTFREDLYYRLNVFPLTVPPLRERGSDIIALADHFVEGFTTGTGRKAPRISPRALDMLMNHRWPGNVRELENVIERAVILCDEDTIHTHHLPPSLQTAKPAGKGCEGNLEAKLQVMEYEMIANALETTNGHIGEAAKRLGLTRRMLGVRMERYGMTYKEFRTADARKTPRPY
jgi:Nif-specific regulatory protein